MLHKTGKQDKYIEVLERFICLYCQKCHSSKKGSLCNECSELLTYAKSRVEKCPHDPKPKCKECKTHCYKPEYRDKIKEVMKFSGMYFVKRGRFDWLIKYFIKQRKL